VERESYSTWRVQSKKSRQTRKEKVEEKKVIVEINENSPSLSMP